jgi:Secretion system C-terminal sorting domain
MKKHITIICCYLLIVSNLNSILGQKIEPSKLKIGDINETSLSISWKNEKNTKHIIIAKKGSPITAKPIDGVDYFESNIFGLGNELADNEFIVYEGNDDQMNLIGLSPNTVYHFAMFEFSGSSYSVEYNKTEITIGNAKTQKASDEMSSKVTYQNIEKSTNNFDDAENLGIKIFGNPVQHILRFEFASSDEVPINAKLYDQLGKEIISQECNPNTKIEINMIQLPSGLYILRVNDGYRFYSSKILKIN